MPQVITFEDYRPAPRYDALAWTDVRIEEGETSGGPWISLEEQPLVPVDSDPTNPAIRNITTELASDTPDLWYRLVFIDASDDESAATTPVQNTSEGTAYATADELARILKIRAPSDAQIIAMNRVLQTAAGEINSEIDLADDSELEAWQLKLAEQVNLERAVEHWQQQESPFGLLGLGAETGVAFASKDSWGRHAEKLAPLKEQWGLA